LKATDAVKRTVTVSSEDGQGLKGLRLAKDAAVFQQLLSLKGGGPKTKHLKLTDLKVGMHLYLGLGIEDGQMVIKGIQVSP
jgi:hypothetical protein